MAGNDACAFRTFAIEGVVGVEWKDLAIRRHEVNAASLYCRQIEIVAIEELKDRATNEPENKCLKTS